MEPIRYGVERSAAESAAVSTAANGNTSAAQGTAVASQMAAQLDGVQRMIDALMPSVDSAVDELACTRNEKGHYCLLFTESLNSMMVGGPAVCRRYTRLLSHS
jgi:hypothetical protein